MTKTIVTHGLAFLGGVILGTTGGWLARDAEAEAEKAKKAAPTGTSKTGDGT